MVTKYEDLKGTVTIVDLEKGQTGGGLGISLAGNRDRNKMSVFVCGLHPQGTAFKDGRIKVGDEILEVSNKLSHIVYNESSKDELKKEPVE
jgi:C-terminal processing protease CtpA/Prc